MPILNSEEAPLYRAFNSADTLTAFCGGSIWLGSLKRYRTTKDGARQDASEGLGHFIDQGGMNRLPELANEIYILCLSTSQVDQGYLRERMGKHVVRVRDLMALAQDIEVALKSHGYKIFRGVHGQRVEYTKGQAAVVDDDPMVRALLSVTQKPDIYAAECEYRLFVLLNRNPPQSPEEYIKLELRKSLPYVEPASP